MYAYRIYFALDNNSVRINISHKKHTADRIEIQDEIESTLFHGH